MQKTIKTFLLAIFSPLFASTTLSEFCTFKRMLFLCASFFNQPNVCSNQLYSILFIG